MGRPNEQPSVAFTRAQVREIDRRAAEQYHIPGIVLMENAARSALPIASRMMADHRLAHAFILCGGGNNGGDGLAIARHLHNQGFQVTLSLSTDPAGYKGDALINWRIVQAMGLPTERTEPGRIEKIRKALIVDAIFGTGLSAPPREPFGQIVAAIEASGCPVLAIDLPSGLDSDTGEPLGPCVVADGTVTFVGWKTGFLKGDASRFLGEVHIGDIGCPRELIEQILRDAPP